MEFLYSLNRLDVATSGAKCVSILVASPQIFEAECRIPRQIQLANAFCRYLEMAKCISFKRAKVGPFVQFGRLSKMPIAQGFPRTLVRTEVMN